MWLLPLQLRASALAAGCLMSASKPDSAVSALPVVLRCVVNGKPTQRESSWSGWKRRSWSLALFGAVTWPGSTFVTWLGSWTLSLRDCHASPTASPANNSVTKTSGATEKTTAGRSRRSSKESASVVPPWCSSKTCLPGLLADGFDHSERNYAEWVTRSRSRSSSLRKRLARAIDASGSSSWPTVRSHEVGNYQNQKDGSTLPTLCGAVSTWPSPRSEDGESCGNHPGATDSLTGATNLWATPMSADDGNKVTAASKIGLIPQVANWATPDATAGKRGNTGYSEKQLTRPQGPPAILNYDVLLWTSPVATDRANRGNRKRKNGHAGGGESNLADDAQQWPTPAARDHKSGEASEETASNNSRPLNEAVLSSPQGPMQTGSRSQNGSGRRLNPAFVCWLMGWPDWWTRTGLTNCDALATAWSQWRQQLQQACCYLARSVESEAA